MTWPFPHADSDARHIDAAIDDLAVDDPYATTWEPTGFTHVAVIAAAKASVPLTAGQYPADARPATDSSPSSRGLAGLSDL